MSLAIPVVFFSVVDGDHPGTLAWIGVVLALIGVYLASVRETNHQLRWQSLLFPSIIFLGSGVIDSSLGYAEKHVLSDDFEVALFACLPFITSFVIGGVFVVRNLIIGKDKLEIRSVIAGIILAIANYFSIFYLIKAFSTEGMSRASVIPVNNIGVVTVSALAALILFKEGFSTKNKIGLLICLLSLVLLVL
jgi:drug/metabolite transporter (DMT)-like permease